MSDLVSSFWDAAHSEENCDFFWLVAHGSKLLANFKPNKIGPDSFEYAVLAKPRTWQKGDRIWHLPNINVDASSKSGVKEAIRSGIYRIVAARHHLGRADEHPAFFIMRYTPHFGRQPTLRDAYNSSLRQKLPSLYNGTTDYINFHRASSSSDGSLGCFTAPPKEFDKFRAPYMELEQGLMLFVNHDELPQLALPASLISEFLMENVHA